jgi:glucose/arabinose dehydrogenase
VKWLLRVLFALVVVVALGVGALLWFVPVSVPLKGMLANWLPGVFETPRAVPEVVEARLTVPEGYGISLFAADVPRARMLRVTANGDVLVTAGRGEVWWLAADRDGDGVSDDRRQLLTGLDRPNGLDIAGGRLYVGETGRIVSVGFDAASGTVVGSPEVLVEGLPAGGNHWRKPLRFGPDGLLYVVVGSSCNVCIEKDERRAAMLRFTRDGEYLGVYAAGLRNSAGFDWRDADGELYATDNGRDLLGDDFPPCELNRIREGAFYGWPFANGDRIPDPQFGGGRDAVIAASTPPVFEFRAHNAPLGMVFLRSPKHAAEFRGAAIVALHGSWNRRIKDGYKVVSLHWGPDDVIESRDFVAGFLDRSPRGDHVIGRPAEVAEDAEGNVYVSDDYANAVYRISPGGATDPLVLTAPIAEGSVPSGGRPAIEAQTRELGERAFAALACGSCHRTDADEPLPEGRYPLAALATRYTVDSMIEFLRHPRQPMPPVTADAGTVDALARYLLATY